MNANRRLSTCILGSLAALFLVPASIYSQNAQNSTMPLVKVTDIPMPGPAVRFDYQNLDAESSRLYISHMNADQLVVFDTATRKVVANLDDFKRVHGVIAVPELGRVYASITGEHAVAVVDAKTLKTLAKPGSINYPDGLAYAPSVKRVFVSDEHGGVDAVIDAASNKLIANIPLGGGAGNTVYDSISGHILVAVHGLNLLAVIDPVTNQIVSRIPLPGIKNPHGIALEYRRPYSFCRRRRESLPCDGRSPDDEGSFHLRGWRRPRRARL
jgi:DNA-binding beta-propeller fold protein YncE